MFFSGILKEDGMLRRKNAWVSLVGIIMCVGLWACTGENTASLDGDGYAGVDDGFGDGDNGVDYDGSGGGAGASVLMSLLPFFRGVSARGRK